MKRNFWETFGYKFACFFFPKLCPRIGVDDLMDFGGKSGALRLLLMFQEEEYS